jgi:anti-repressor protein
MGNGLQIFNFEGSAVRIVLIDSVPWWIAKDVSDILDYTDTQAMTRRLDSDEQKTCTDISSGQGRHVLIINESGLYDSILGSTKPEAKKFKKWITSIVLPSIRKTGSYSIQPQLPKNYAEALRELASTVEANDKLTKENEAMQPKVAQYDKFLDSTTTISQTYAAKLLGILPKTFFAWLKDIGAEYKNNTQMIRNEYLLNGWFTQKLYPQEVLKDGVIEIHPRERARITTKGLAGLEELAKEYGLIAQGYIVEFIPEEKSYHPINNRLTKYNCVTIDISDVL